MPRSCTESLSVILAKASFINFALMTMVEVDKAELDSLSEASRRLGCGPSLNAHDKTASINVDASTYLKRSAGGHIHLGGVHNYPYYTPDHLATLMDIIVGNTCVMIDRDPNAAERRKVYGRRETLIAANALADYRSND